MLLKSEVERISATKSTCTVAPVADKVMQAAGYVYPIPPGVDPNLPYPGGNGDITMNPIANKRTGTEFQPASAAATEAPLRGESNSGTSGIKFSLQQNAAITPLNTWVKAEKRSELAGAVGYLNHRYMQEAIYEW